MIDREAIVHENPEVAMWLFQMDYATMKWCKDGRPSRAKRDEFSKYRHVHLIAMRCFRNIDRRKMSHRSGIPFCVLEYFETTRDAVIPKYVEEIYIQTLKLQRHEIKKVAEIVAGERTLEEEKDREIPHEVKKAVVKRDKNRCAGCGHKQFLHFHHIKHFSKGGLHTAENIKLLCIACHAKEHQNDKSFHMLKRSALDLMGVVI